MPKICKICTPHLADDHYICHVDTDARAGLGVTVLAIGA